MGDAHTTDETPTVSEDFVQSPTHKAASTKHLDFNGLLQPALQLREDLSEGNGGQAWPAGEILARYLLCRKRDELRRAGTIVELGAGGGLVGLAVALACRSAAEGSIVHITDQAPMLALMQQNISLNSLDSKIEAAVYNWGSPRPDAIPARVDVILAADCVYFEPAFPLLQQTLQELIGAETVCYFCFKRRRRADMHFLKTIRKMFCVEDVVDDPASESYAGENMFLCTIRKKASR